MYAYEGVHPLNSVCSCVHTSVYYSVCVCVCVCVCTCMYATGMHVINSRGVLIIGTANKLATNMFIFTVSVQITKEADTSTNILSTSKINFHLTYTKESIVTKSY